MGYVLVFIVGHGESSIDQAMMVTNKGYDKVEQERILKEAARMGIDSPEIIGQVDIPDHIADSMCDGRMYIG